MCLHNSAAQTRSSRVSALGCSIRKTGMNFDPCNFENFQDPSVNPLPCSDMSLSQSPMEMYRIADLSCADSMGVAYNN